MTGFLLDQRDAVFQDTQGFADVLVKLFSVFGELDITSLFLEKGYPEFLFQRCDGVA